MKPLDQYPTPLTDAHLGAQTRTYSPSANPNFARTLERKLAMAREALEFYRTHMLLGYDITDSGQVAIEALSATAPTP